MSLLKVLSLSGACLLTCVLAATQQAQAPFSLNIAAKDDTVQAGSEVRVKIVLTNISDQVIYVVHEKAADIGEQVGFALDVRDSGGNTVPFTKYGQRFYNDEIVSVGAPFPADLKPGKALKDEIVVSKLFDLSNPGKYSIQVQRKDDKTGAIAKSNTITVTVTPVPPATK